MFGSEREKLQAKILGWLQSWATVMGPEMVPVPRGGFIRVVTFSRPFGFTATLYIWSVNRMSLKVSGLMREYYFTTYEEFEEFCITMLNAPRQPDQQQHQIAELERVVETLRAENRELREFRESVRASFGGRI